jgi:flavin reductase (DIM6/NTAB) family NADH-FMN oxidoreductase RutF
MLLVASDATHGTIFWDDYFALTPPSQGRTTPVVQRDSSDSRNSGQADNRPPWPGNEALMAEHDFNALMAALDSPLIVVTTADERERAGCLVEFHVQSSMEPQRYCVWLSKANYTYRVALQSSYLVIHFLTADDLPLAELFGTQTGDTVDKFAGLPVDSGPGGAPVLRQCPNWLAVRRIALLDEGGDHVCLPTEPVAVHTLRPFRPLRLSQAGHLKAGHGAEERPEPPTERAAPA